MADRGDFVAALHATPVGGDGLFRCRVRRPLQASHCRGASEPVVGGFTVAGWRPELEELVRFGDRALDPPKPLERRSKYTEDPPYQAAAAWAAIVSLGRPGLFRVHDAGTLVAWHVMAELQGC